MVWERRADLTSTIGTAFVLGWLSCAGYYSLTNLWKVQDKFVTVETRVVPALQTQVKQAVCDKSKMTDLAARGIAANESGAVAAPQWKDLSNCPAVAPVKPPPIAKILPK